MLRDGPYTAAVSQGSPHRLSPLSNQRFKKKKSRNQRRFKTLQQPTFPTCPQPFCLRSCSFDSRPGMGFGSRGCFQQACRDKAAYLLLPGGQRSRLHPRPCPHSSILVQQAECEGRVRSAPGTALPDTPSIRAHGIWHFSIFQATGRLSPLSQQGVSPVKAISN